jgi:hypothetical protein
VAVAVGFSSWRSPPLPSPEKVDADEARIWAFSEALGTVDHDHQASEEEAEAQARRAQARAQAGEAKAQKKSAQVAAGVPAVCKPAESRKVGKMVPGRKGGPIAGCATPSAERPRERQWWIGLPVAGIGHPIRKSTAARRIRDQGKPRRSDDPGDVARASTIALAAGRDHIPHPAGLEFPHIVGSSRCDAEHKVWVGYPRRLHDALDTAGERAAIEIPEDASEADYRRAVDRIAAEELRHDPKHAERLAAELLCARGWQARERARKGKAEFSEQRQKARARQDAKNQRLDLTSAEYLDTLRSREAKGKHHG